MLSADKCILIAYVLIKFISDQSILDIFLKLYILSCILSHVTSCVSQILRHTEKAYYANIRQTKGALLHFAGRMGFLEELTGHFSHF